MSRIFFVCPDEVKPAGGIKQIYRQVEVLNNYNFKAYVLHGEKPFKVSWFDSKVPVLWDNRVNQINKPLRDNLKKEFKEKVKNLNKFILKFFKRKQSKIEFLKDDIIVLPEFYGKHLDNLFPNQLVVLYNQNCYYSFRGYGYSKVNKESIYNQERLKAIIVASENALNYLGLFIHNKSLFRVKYGIDNQIFSFSESKKKQIAFMPRKLREDSEQILNILYQNNSLLGWTIKPIDGLNEKEVSKLLKESAVFLSFNYREGFGMPPAEAMACGCIVVGYAGQGGKEVLHPDFSYPIDDRDIISFVNTLLKVIKDYNKDKKPFFEKGKKASEFILSNYSMYIEEQTIINTWKNILKLIS